MSASDHTQLAARANGLLGHVRNGGHNTKPDLPADTLRAAVRRVASSATNADDCATLLAALGLDPRQGQPGTHADTDSTGEAA